MADNKAKEVDLSSPEFMDNLETALEPNLRTEPEKPKEKEADNKAEKVTTVASDWEKLFKEEQSKREQIEKRYESSSKEGKRLAEQLDNLKPYEPLLSTIGSDAELQKKIEQHIKGFPAKEDEVDFDEILTDKEKFAQAVRSEAGKVAKELLSAEREKDSKERKRDQILSEEKKFQEQYELSEDQMDEFRDWMKKTPLTHERLWALKNHKEVGKKKDSNDLQEKLSQLLKNQGLPKTLASMGSTEVDKDPVDAIMDVFLKDSSVDNLLR